MKKLMAANWKMYKTREEAAMTIAALMLAVGMPPADREVLVFPPFTAIECVSAGIGDADGYAVGGQDVYPAAEGAFTGEISPAMLKDAGATWALTGHSERRHVLGESDELVGRKTAFALEQGLHVVLCIGETLQEREAGQLAAVLARQLETGLAGVPKDVAVANLAIAYEPVWAIGTGKVAGPAEILDAHATVRRQLQQLLATGSELRILYGGSVKPENTAEIISLDNVDGVLVGGASLQAESFSRIVLA
ncbi:triose-phosphate isomerase [Megalodesulfovibrio gigas]|uniref:Triosephosphate isomerase n=1 Tax=Megalodesulfovibrio gigas (strain ATCC 19364 / DSM 1382 / NCIMB 9332 / VKM B-1759) TaxID=1121448 RepID=T2G7J2_MEGG1|nr:triose-phosphate isomerase [Megalodesulfovibrio gigas]AGW12258.1 putative triose-phosphate isomerase [Megalodesulfovibrio gigas DSM 1382 = ATCC 19364]